VTPAITVVVPTYGRPALIERCLQALSSQTLPLEQYEIVVVADGPDAATRAAVERTGMAVRLLELTRRRGPAAARNAGWRAARAPIVAFTDDDTLPAPEWLAEGLSAIRRGCDAVSGRVVMPVPGVPTDYERDAARLGSAEFVTANCFVTVATLRSIGGFDERFELPWREDSDLQFALLEHGARLEHEPRAVVVHPIRGGRWGVSLSQQRKVQFDALLYKKHPKLYRERIRRAPRVDYYATVGALAAGLGAAMAGWWALAMAAAAAWLVLTVRFCAERLAGTRKDLRHIGEMIATSAAIPPLAVFWRFVGAVRFRVVLL
jgi:glycosyltransferase involved in cell wall biosynthesis